MWFIRLNVVTVSLILLCYTEFGTSIPTQVITLAQNVTAKQPRLPLIYVGTVDGIPFFKEPIAMTWNDALINCNTPGLGLAQIKKNSDIDGLKLLKVTGMHWINGVDRGDSEQFVLSNGEKIADDVTRYAFTPITCLVLVDQGTLTNIRNFDCTTRLPSLCA